MKIKSTIAIVICIGLSSFSIAQTPADDVPQASIALSPAVIMIRCRPGQSTTQTLTIINHSPSDASFVLTTEDVVITDGRRSFSPAGQVANGIAATSIASPTSLVVKAGSESSVQVTFTIPPETGQRAVVTFFHATIAPPSGGTVGLSASLGALITFNVSGDYKLDAGQLQVSPQTASTNLILSSELRNIGSEPLVPKGVIVIMNASGKRVSKAAFNSQRVLPGERMTFSATNSTQLAPGHYLTLASFEFESKVLNSAGEFTIPE